MSALYAVLGMPLPPLLAFLRPLSLGLQPLPAPLFWMLAFLPAIVVFFLESTRRVRFGISPLRFAIGLGIVYAVFYAGINAINYFLIKPLASHLLSHMK